MTGSLIKCSARGTVSPESETGQQSGADVFSLTLKDSLPSFPDTSSTAKSAAGGRGARFTVL
jgi:hypothetical protein